MIVYHSHLFKRTLMFCLPDVCFSVFLSNLRAFEEAATRDSFNAEDK